MIEGVVVVVVRDGRFLMIRRAPGILAGNAWCFVGGAIEAGETQEMAAVREFREEVGGQIRAIRKIWEHTRADGGLRLHWWLAELDSDELAPNELEVAEIQWVALEKARRLPGLLESNAIFLDRHADELLR